MADGSEPRTGGRLVVDALRAHGVDTVFCVPGESYVEVLDALYDHADAIRVISCRHEHGAANMAEAYAKLTGKTGVCMVTRGPGACNASIGIHTAMQDSTPVLLLVGQVPRRFSGREAFQEVDYRWMFGPLAKWVEQVEDPAQVSEMMAAAFRAAISGRPGPAVLALPEDMLRQACVATEPAVHDTKPRQPEASDLDRLRLMLGEAQRPVMLIGGGAWTDSGREAILAFATANNLATCCSFRRHDLMDNTSPCFIGELGIAVSPALTQRVKDADLLLVVGARLGEMTTQQYSLIDEPVPAQRLIHVHAGLEELGRVFRPELAIHANPAVFAEAAAAREPVAGPWADWVADARRDYEANQVPEPSDVDLDLGQVMLQLRDRLPGDAIVAVDAGNYSSWAQRFLSFGGGRRLLGPTSGAMGYGVPAAVAAKSVYPDRMVVGCVGDGCFGMTGQEVSTAVQYGLNPIILVFNNAMYGTIRMHQERRHPDRKIGTDLADLDFAAIARAYGAHGETVAKTKEFLPAFERAVESGRAAVIDLRMDPDVISARTTLTAIREAATKGP